VATNDQLKALVKSHADGDDPQFYAVAMQVAAKAARAGQSKFAQELRDLVDELRKRGAIQSRTASVVPVTQPRGELGSLLSVTYPDARLADLVLSAELSERLKRVLLEQRQRDTRPARGSARLVGCCSSVRRARGRRRQLGSLPASSGFRCLRSGWT
jgi:hypothetical protein